MDALEKINNEQLRVIKHQLKGKCENQSASSVEYKEAFLSVSKRTEKAENHTPGRVIRVAKLQYGYASNQGRSAVSRTKDRRPNYKRMRLSCMERLISG